MITRNRKWLLGMAFVLAFITVAAGCSRGASTSESPAKSEPPGTPAKSETPEKKPEERIKMSMFMSNSGLKHPDGVDTSNNPFINIVEDYANVDLDVEVPNYQDFPTKLDLLLASGKLTDVVHSYNLNATYGYARQGAFIDLKKYYDKSPVMQKLITPEMLELSKDPLSGKYWRMPMAYNTSPSFWINLVRFDKIKKYNDGKWPETVEQWVELLRKIKKAEPTFTLIANNNGGEAALGYSFNTVYSWFGAIPYDYRIQNGKIISTFTTPEYLEATKLMKQLYDEGIVAKDFATIDRAAYAQLKANNNLFTEYQQIESVVGIAQTKKTEGAPNEYGIAPPLKQYPAVLKDPKYAQPKINLPILDHGLYISSASKNPDRAWKVLEGFASDKLYEAIFWGKEGETYTMKDGKRVPDAKKINDPSRTWALHLGVLFGFQNGQDKKRALAELILGQQETNNIYKDIDIYTNIAKNNGHTFHHYVSLSADATKKRSEGNLYITQSTVEAIMGKITFDEFQKRASEFDKKFGSVAQEYQKYVDENKDRLIKLGFKEVAW
jgi:putative aldouronate transport system substrate-binding protein